MPISSFSKGLQNVLGCLPGTYSVGIMRNHYMGGYLTALSDAGVPEEAIEAVRDGFDANITVFGTQIPLWAMYTILLGSCAVLLAAFVTLIILKNKKK